MTRRPPGTGSVYYDATRGRWVGTYEAGWTTRGTRRRRKVTGRTEAETRRRLLTRIRETTTDDATGTHPTVKRWAETWLTITAHRHRPATFTANRSAVGRWIIPTIGHKRLDRLTPADVRAVTRAILDAGRAPATARRTQAVLEKMLRDAIVEGYTVPPGVLLVSAPARGENDRGVIPLADALTLLTAALDTPDGSRWVAAFLQGMRQAECLGLTWECVDLDRGTIDVSWQLKALPYRVARDRSSGFRVPDGFVARHLDGAMHLVRPKTAHGRRVIPVVPAMADRLSLWRSVAPASPHGLVWPRPDGRPRDPSDDRTAWYGLQDAAGIAHATGRHYVIHEIRHTGATLLRAAGVDDETITAIMGHASILSTRDYLHTDDAAMRAAITGLAARLGQGPRQVEG